jgi:hypothetical protein
MIKFRHAAAVAGLAALFASSNASAAPCAGFTDVDDADPNTAPFCSSVEWIKNRGVTSGCTSTLYCPQDNVTRLQMAAFMKRLGDRLTADVLTNTDAVGAVDLDRAVGVDAAHLCRVGPVAAATYPRRAIVYAQFSGFATGPLQVFGTTSASVNGAPFALTATGGIGMRDSTTAASTWVNVTQTASVNMAPGSTYSFAMFVNRAVEDVASNDISSGRCNLTVQVINAPDTAPTDAPLDTGWRDNNN